MKRVFYILEKIAYVLIAIAVIMIILGITLTMIDFYNDYQCSTTTDIKWFIDNDCMRYVK